MADLYKILKDLNQIKPDSDYSRRSRTLILYTGNNLKILNFPVLKMAMVAVFVLFLIIFGGVYYTNQLNQEKLIVKASEINTSIQIKLDEIKYILENKPQLNLSDISTIQTLLDEANKELKEASVLSVKSEKLGEVLEKIKSAQEDFLKINSMLKQ